MSAKNSISNASPAALAGAGAVSGAKVSAASASTTVSKNNSTTTTTSVIDITDQAVLAYLQKKGLGQAVLELTRKLKEESTTTTESLTVQQRLEEEDNVSRTQRSLLSKSTGGHFGYDRDSAWPVAQWGFPSVVLPTATSSSSTTPASPALEQLGVEEARAYLDSFVTLQLWVLSLPDEHAGTYENPLVRAQALLRSQDNVSISQVMQELLRPSVPVDDDNNNTNNKETGAAEYNLPPSIKNELLSVTFALLVHTYCELLEVGMETTAHMLRDAFAPIYTAVYESQYRDLYSCTTTEEMTRLNSHNGQHMEALATLKTILVQVASYQLRREELRAQTTVNGGTPLDAKQQAAKDQKIADYDRVITGLRTKYTELSQKASACFEKMQDLPFLRRARAVRWQLTLSHSSYASLCHFLNARDDSLLAMSTLLQSKCELHVERRPPVPFVPPASVFSENEKRDSAVAKLTLHSLEIQWATPTPRLSSASERKPLPFPKYELDEEYENEAEAKRDQRAVEFNRALLMHGFRRLEALERKREYDVLPTATKRLKQQQSKDVNSTRILADALEPTILLTTLCSSNSKNDNNNSSSSGLVKTKAATTTSTGTTARSSSAPPPPPSSSYTTDVSTIWEEASMGLCCAKLCEPDGRRVAVGCEDSAVRVWDCYAANQKSNVENRTTSKEPLQVLLGHKNGFPVFGVDWNRDGRSLLSCGGDGSIRLWDTMLTGPFGETAEPHSAVRSQPTEGKLARDSTTVLVPELRPETAPYTSGAALAVYRGHAPGTPVWSVAFSPAGYYFCSTGGDATARLWVTDRPVPVRLFTGHTSHNVNCCEWHPNCNYLLTGSDDRTARLWDIQTGRTVRLLTGAAGAVNAVCIDPSGRHAAVADVSGTVALWDLGSGRKVTELRSTATSNNKKVTSAQGTSCSSSSSSGSRMVHALRFSACGSALATGGDDCCVRIWDVRQDSIAEKPLISTPSKAYVTPQPTMLLDLHYTKHNLLLAMGKYVTPIGTNGGRLTA